ncbi:MAG: hypothetical protein ACP5G0_04730 [Desulfomonilia bacterium]
MSLEEFFGWCIAGFVFLSLLNYLLKQISREYIKNLPPNRQDFAQAYRRVMRVVVRNHRFFGFAALVFLAAHTAAVFLAGFLSATGLLTAAALVISACLGLYGYYINRDYRAWWLSVHRLFALIVIVTFIIHFFFKKYIFL